MAMYTVRTSQSCIDNSNDEKISNLRKLGFKIQYNKLLNAGFGSPISLVSFDQVDEFFNKFPDIEIVSKTCEIWIK